MTTSEKNEKSNKENAPTQRLEEMDEEQLREYCREHVCKECPELADQKSEVLRILADSENLKKRLTREKEEYCKFATENILEDILPVLDNLELALEHGRGNEACKDILQGVEMTLSIFQETLGRHGLTPVGNEGDRFDPALHEAIGQEPREDMEPGSICKLYQKGYKLKDRLLRPAKVIVSSG
ncbi:MAG: nucleotide exchange factor GrpE [Desulfovibrionales bacterium]